MAEIPGSQVKSNCLADDWITVWSAAPQLTEPYNLPDAPFSEVDRIFHNTTIRQTLRVTADAQDLRCRISNVFGCCELHVTAMTCALPDVDPSLRSLSGSRTIRPETLSAVTFGGLQSVEVPKGSTVVSDAFTLPIRAGQILAASIFLRHGQNGRDITSHPGSRTDSWLAHGNCVARRVVAEPSLEGLNVKHWYYLSAIEAPNKRSERSLIAILGDSISDGRISTDNGNDRWTDKLFDKIQLDRGLRDSFAMANQSIGGNRVLNNGVGPSALSRFERDLLELPHLHVAIVMIGVNDIGTAEPDEADVVGDRLIQAYKQIARCLATRDVTVLGSTLPPFAAPESANSAYSHPARIKVWQRVNGWIRTSKSFDAVLDVASILANLVHPTQLQRKYDSGDYLHPNLLGFQAIADAFPLERLRALKQSPNELGIGR